jgi:hypothetical protein
MFHEGGFACTFYRRTARYAASRLPGAAQAPDVHTNTAGFSSSKACVRARARVRACVHACVRVCVRACERERALVFCLEHTNAGLTPHSRSWWRRGSPRRSRSWSHRHTHTQTRTHTHTHTLTHTRTHTHPSCSVFHAPTRLIRYVCNLPPSHFSFQPTRPSFSSVLRPFLTSTSHILPGWQTPRQARAAVPASPA